jgi:hypothetical protein
VENLSPRVNFDEPTQSKHNSHSNANDGDTIPTKKKPSVGLSNCVMPQAFRSPKIIDPRGVGRILHRWEKNPLLEIPADDTEPDRLNISEKVTYSPTKRFATAKGIFADVMSNRAKDKA